MCAIFGRIYRIAHSTVGHNRTADTSKTQESFADVMSINAACHREPLVYMVFIVIGGFSVSDSDSTAGECRYFSVRCMFIN